MCMITTIFRGNNCFFNIITGQEQRTSVPLHEIRLFLIELIKSSEEWKVMKLIILGHGGIGKTTMLHVLKDILLGSQV